MLGRKLDGLEEWYEGAPEAQAEEDAKSVVGLNAKADLSAAGRNCQPLFHHPLWYNYVSTSFFAAFALRRYL